MKKLLFIVMVFILGQGYGQDYMADSTIVDSVLYEGWTLMQDETSDCHYFNHDWCYESSPLSGYRICRYCYRWEHFYTLRVKKHKDTEYEFILKKVVK